jgi:hypothetical protein
MQGTKNTIRKTARAKTATPAVIPTGMTQPGSGPAATPESPGAPGFEH